MIQRRPSFHTRRLRPLPTTPPKETLVRTITRNADASAYLKRAAGLDIEWIRAEVEQSAAKLVELERLVGTFTAADIDEFVRPAAFVIRYQIDDAKRDGRQVERLEAQLSALIRRFGEV